MTILNWQENLALNEQPPEWMWALDDELEEWFEEIEAARAARFRRDDDDYEPPESQMMTNELARGRR